MKIVSYLQIAQRGTRRGAVVSASVNPPVIARGNLLMKLVLEVPDDAFTTFIPEAVVHLVPGTNAAYIVADAEMPDLDEEAEQNKETGR